MYDLGSGVGLLGGVTGIGVASWATWTVWMTVWDEVRIHAGQLAAGEGGLVTLINRAIQAVNQGGIDAGSSRRGSLQPLVSLASAIESMLRIG